MPGTHLVDLIVGDDSVVMGLADPSALLVHRNNDAQMWGHLPNVGSQLIAVVTVAHCAEPHLERL